MLWSNNCVISEISRKPVVSANTARETTETTRALFQIISAKIYVPAVTLSINDDIKFLENIELGFNRIVSWDK